MGFLRYRVRVERTALGIAGGQNKVVEAAQDEARPTMLPGETPKAKNLLFGEGQSLLRAHFPKAQEPGRRHLRDRRSQTVAAGRELTKRAEDHSPAFARGLNGQRGWARLILGRLHDLALSPGDSKGSTLDPDTVAHEHHSFFFPDSRKGAANAAGFGWRNGG